MRCCSYDAFYKLTDGRKQLTAYVFDVVRASVPKMDLDEIYVVRLMPHPAAGFPDQHHQLYGISWR